MYRLLELAEYVASKLAYPKVAVAVANRLLGPQDLDVQEDAQIGRDCRIRGDVTLGPGSKVSRGCTLVGDVEVGKRTNLNRDIEVIGDVTIGKYCALARDTLFQQKDHQIHKPAIQMRFYGQVLDSKLEHVTKGPITVGNDVWIGARAIVLSGVTIGDGAVVAAGSIVTDNVEPYAIVAGVPAERVKWRFSEDIREKLLDLSWWDLDDETLRRHGEFFNTEITSPDDVSEVDGSLPS
jgi:virginiamycin A acetyltransferase